MKKILSFLLVLIFIFSLAACGKSNEDTTTTEPTEKVEDVKAEVIETEAFEVELLKCIFTDEIFGQDTEQTGSGYTKRTGKVFVDLVLKVKNTGTTDFTKDSVSAYFMYGDRRYDMQFGVESKTLSSMVSSGKVSPDDTALVHLFGLVEEAAKEEVITVIYNIAEKDYEAKVTKEEISDPLSAKTEVKVGNKVNVDDLYSFEVISCGVKQHLMASDTANSQVYKPIKENTQFLDLVIKIKNNTKLDLKSINTYTIINGELVSCNTNKEIKNNTTFDSLMDEPLAANEEAYCHIYTAVDKSVNTNGLVIRFNLGNTCYYIKVAE